MSKIFNFLSAFVTFLSTFVDFSSLSVHFFKVSSPFVKFSLTLVNSAGRDGSPGALQLLQQRTWLLHWSLFIFFNGLQRGKELLIELFLHNPDYTHAVQTMAPWLLRYLAKQSFQFLKPDFLGI